MLIGRLLSIVLLLFLTACAGPATRDTPAPEWLDRQNTLQTLNAWTVSGKLALRSEVASETASLRWQQRGNHANLLLSGPLGIGATTIDSDGHTLHIQQSGETRILDISTPEAVQLNTGWDLPLAALPFWLRGIPSPEYPVQAQAFDAQGSQLQSLEQNGWQIEFQAYGQFAEHSLPTRMVVERGNTRVKLVLRNWTELPPP